MRDKNARQLLKLLTIELGYYHTRFDPDPALFKDTGNTIRDRLYALEGKVDRLLEYLEVEEHRPNCKPKFIKRGGPEQG